MQHPRCDCSRCRSSLTRGSTNESQHPACARHCERDRSVPVFFRACVGRRNLHDDRWFHCQHRGRHRSHRVRLGQHRQRHLFRRGWFALQLPAAITPWPWVTSRRPQAASSHRHRRAQPGLGRRKASPWASLSNATANFATALGSGANALGHQQRGAGRQLGSQPRQQRVGRHSRRGAPDHQRRGRHGGDRCGEQGAARCRASRVRQAERYQGQRANESEMR